MILQAWRSLCGKMRPLNTGRSGSPDPKSENLLTTYQSLGIRPIINANATLTRLGGSLMPPEVLQAMNEAANCFVDLHELQLRVGKRIAELTHNEAAYIACGAAAGLVLAAAACITG